VLLIFFPLPIAAKQQHGEPGGEPGRTLTPESLLEPAGEPSALAHFLVKPSWT